MHLLLQIDSVIHEREALRRQSGRSPRLHARARSHLPGRPAPSLIGRHDHDGIAARRLERRAALVEHNDVRFGTEASPSPERLAAPDRKPAGTAVAWPRARATRRARFRGDLRKELPPRLPPLEAFLRRLRSVVVLKRPLQLQRLLVGGEASTSAPATLAVVSLSDKCSDASADAVAVPQCGRRAAAQDIHAALQEIVDGELTVRDG